MKLFVQSDAFRALNVGVCLDEGDPSTDDHYGIYYDEKVLWSKYEKLPNINVYFIESIRIKLQTLKSMFTRK